MTLQEKWIYEIAYTRHGLNDGEIRSYFTVKAICLFECLSTALFNRNPARNTQIKTTYSRTVFEKCLYFLQYCQDQAGQFRFGSGNCQMSALVQFELNCIR